MSSVRAGIYAKLYRSAADATVKAAEAVPESNRFRQATEGKAHPLWLLGHLTMSFDMLTNHWMLDRDMAIPAKWAGTFGPTEFGGSPITTSADDYPAWDDILAAYKKAGDTAVEAVGALTDEQLDGMAFGPMPDQFKEQFGVLDVAIPGNASHDTHHRGQMSLLAGMK